MHTTISEVDSRFLVSMNHWPRLYPNPNLSPNLNPNQGNSGFDDPALAEPMDMDQPAAAPAPAVGEAAGGNIDAGWGGEWGGYSPTDDVD